MCQERWSASRAEPSVRERVFLGEQGHKQWDNSSSQHNKTGTGVHGQNHGQAPKQEQQQQQSTSDPVQHTGSKATGAAPGSTTPTGGASGTRQPKKTVVTGTVLAGPATSTQTDDDYVCICVRRAKEAPVDAGAPRRCNNLITRALGRKVSHQSFNQFRYSCRHPRLSRGDSSTTSYARVSVLQPGGSGDTSVETVDTRTAFGDTDAACHGASCGSRCVRGC